jgi:hypothetical protein
MPPYVARLEREAADSYPVEIRGELSRCGQRAA